MTPVTFDDVAGAYDTFVGRWTRAFLPALLRAARVERGQCVLDLATGTGESALMVHDAVGASGQVVGVDISLPMLRGAAAKVDRRTVVENGIAVRLAQLQCLLDRADRRLGHEQ